MASEPPVPRQSGVLLFVAMGIWPAAPVLHCGEFLFGKDYRQEQGTTGSYDPVQSLHPGVLQISWILHGHGQRYPGAVWGGTILRCGSSPASRSFIFYVPCHV